MRSQMQVAEQIPAAGNVAKIDLEGFEGSRTIHGETSKKVTVARSHIGQLLAGPVSLGTEIEPRNPVSAILASTRNDLGR